MANLGLIAGRVYSPGGGFSVSETRPQEVKLALFKDLATLVNTAGSSLNSATETMDLALDLWADLRRVKMYPVWKTVSLWSSESWALCGGVELTLGQ